LCLFSTQVSVGQWTPFYTVRLRTECTDLTIECPTLRIFIPEKRRDIQDRVELLDHLGAPYEMIVVGTEITVTPTYMDMTSTCPEGLCRRRWYVLFLCVCI